MVRLLAKERRLVQSKLLWPISVLPVSAKAYSNLLLEAVEPYDIALDEGMVGFRKNFQCAELISISSLAIRVSCTNRLCESIRISVAYSDLEKYATPGRTGSAGGVISPRDTVHFPAVLAQNVD